MTDLSFRTNPPETAADREERAATHSYLERRACADRMDAEAGEVLDLILAARALLTDMDRWDGGVPAAILKLDEAVRIQRRHVVGGADR